MSNQCIVREAEQLILLGHDSPCVHTIVGGLKSTFASSTLELAGYVNIEGRLHVVSAPDSCRPVTTAASPHLSHVALTATERVCVVLMAKPREDIARCLEFESWASFCSWYLSPLLHSKSNGPQPQTHSIQGAARSVSAGAVSFTLLTEAGEVYTWAADARHSRCLGRAIDAAEPADKPGLVDMISGMGVTKIVQGGWLSAALTKDFGAFLWGVGRPSQDSGTARNISRLESSVLSTGEEDVRMIELPEEEEVVDLGVGGGHMVVLTESGKMWTAGENESGQLGIGNGELRYSGDWVRVPSPEQSQLLHVWCGDKCTLVTLRSSSGDCIGS